MLHAQIDITGMLWIAKGLDFVLCVKVHNRLRMKVIKNLTVKMTYRVGLCDVEVPDDVYDSLAKCYDEGGDVPMPGESDKDSVEASEWLSDNIREADAMDWDYEIEDFEE